MLSYLKLKSKIFYDELFSNLLFSGILAAYILLKAISNLAYGASHFIAFRSGIMGVVMYVVGMYAINLTSNYTDEKNQPFQIDTRVAKKGLVASAVYFLFLFTTIIDNLQRKSILSGTPILSFLPGYNHLTLIIGRLSQSISDIESFVQPEQIRNIILGNLFYVLIPFIIFKLLGYQFKGFFSLRYARASWPILCIYLIMFLTSGITIKKVWGFVYSLLYPALCEEFFHRGIIFRSASSIFKKLPIALLIGAIPFGLMHFPDYFFRIYEGNLLLSFSNIADLFLFSFLLAYGYKKTGTLLPWILVHALSDALYL
ncbi:MAG: CPBP family intramembrane glutamic endopeptidase [Dethiobacteria bacterium]|jgi:membrane protease YdiL (CAAX protease family)|nr:CPBP family intramembrane metalloprotease [Bacillota bacterium]